MKLKIILSLLIFAGAAGQIVDPSIYGLSAKQVVVRDAKGFVVDGKQVKIVATEEQKQAFKQMMDSSAEPQLPEGADDVPTLSESNVVIPSQEESTELPQLPPMEESDYSEVDELSPEVSPVQKAQDSPNKDTVNMFEYLQQKKLISCKTKTPTGVIPAPIWNYIVEKFGASSFEVTEVRSLPEIAEQTLGEQDCWAKLWSQNPNIENPYDIPVGSVIYFKKDEPARVPAQKSVGSEE